MIQLSLARDSLQTRSGRYSGYSNHDPSLFLESGREYHGMLPVFHSTYIDECCIKSQWEVRMSNSKGLPYFFNKDTKESFWDAPSDLSEEQVKALPGAEYLTGASKGRAGQVRASHLLVKHQGSRRPSSWKEVSC